jgi:predicted flap endonuclease-1-like 5' DNA nuclease
LNPQILASGRLDRIAGQPPIAAPHANVNGLTLLALIVLAIGIAVAYRFGVMHGRRQPRAPAVAATAPIAAEPQVPEVDPRIPSLEAENAKLREQLAASHAETVRYRQIVVDIENNAPPPLLDSPGAPDDLKLIVGIGPVLERMLQQLGIGTYRQIARWTDRDIDEFDARLHEFPGRIRRDEWVTQARALHQSKYGEPPR